MGYRVHQVPFRQVPTRSIFLKCILKNSVCTVCTVCSLHGLYFVLTDMDRRHTLQMDNGTDPLLACLKPVLYGVNQLHRLALSKNTLELFIYMQFKCSFFQPGVSALPDLNEEITVLSLRACMFNKWPEPLGCLGIICTIHGGKYFFNIRPVKIKD